jgi:hypothetical protein
MSLHHHGCPCTVSRKQHSTVGKTSTPIPMLRSQRNVSTGGGTCSGPDPSTRSSGAGRMSCKSAKCSLVNWSAGGAFHIAQKDPCARTAPSTYTSSPMMKPASALHVIAIMFHASPTSRIGAEVPRKTPQAPLRCTPDHVHIQRRLCWHLRESLPFNLHSMLVRDRLSAGECRQNARRTGPKAESRQSKRS